MRGSWLVGAGLVALALAVGWWSRGSAPAAAQEEPPEIEWLRAVPVYPGAVPYSLGERAAVGPHRFQAAYYSSDASVPAIVDFLDSAWRGQGRTVRVNSQRGQTVLSSLDPDSKRLHSLVVVDQGQTRVVVATSTPLDGEDTAGAPLPLELPPMPGSRQVHRTAFEDQGLRSATTIYGVGAEPAKVQHWYRSQMPALGFSLEREDTHNGMDILHYQAGSVAVDVGISAVSTTPPVSMIGVVYLEQP